MVWPTTNVSTDNLDASTDTPAAARGDLLEAVIAVNAMIDSKDAISGVAGLDATGKVLNTKLPNTLISSTGSDLSLVPDTGRVSIVDLINLTSRSVSDLSSFSAVVGDVAYCSDGDAGSPCLAVYNGSNWKVLSFGATIAIA